MCRFIVIKSLVFFGIIGLCAQSTFDYSEVKDSSQSTSWVKKSILPIGFIVIGTSLHKSEFEMNFQRDLRNKVGNDYRSHIDDYLQYVPIVEMYLADIFHIRSKNHWFDQSRNLLISNLFTATIVHSLKRTTQKYRPTGSPHSFPSGHTSFAFTNASVLFHEFKSSSPLLAYSGFAFSTATGAFRVINNQHWISDVLVAAGVGIIVTELVYYFEPFKNFNPFIKSKNISFLPSVGVNHLGLYMVYYL